MTLGSRIRSMAIGASASFRRWLHAGRVDDRIRALEAELDLHPGASSDRFRILNDLGNRWRDRHMITSDAADLEASVQRYRRALEVADGPDQARFARANLAVVLIDRYRETDSIVDLDAAIDLGREAVRGSMPGSVEHVRALGNLANALTERYRRSLLATDLDEAIRIAEEAVEYAPAASGERTAATVNLAVALLTRGDLSRAIELLEPLVAAAEDRSPLHVAASSALTQARLLGLQTDAGDPGEETTRSEQELRRLAASSPPGSIRKHAMLHSLGKSLWNRYEREGGQPLLEAAIEALEKAVAATPDGAGELPLYLTDFGIALSERTRISDSAQGLAEAIAVWTRALQILDDDFAAVPVGYKLGQQNLSASLRITERLVSGYLILFERVIAGDASRLLREALLAIENDKSRVITELIGRSDLPAPAGAPTDHVTRERELLAELRKLDATALSEYGGQPVSATHGAADRTGRRTALRSELERTWNTLATAGEEAAEYVGLRRGRSVAWGDLTDLAVSRGPGTALVSMFATNIRTLMFVLPPEHDTPHVTEVSVGHEDWSDILRRFERTLRSGGRKREVFLNSAAEAGTDHVAEPWDLSLRPMFNDAADQLAGVERVVLVPHRWGLRLPWSVVARHAGWVAADGGPVPLVTIESLELLRRLCGRPRTREGRPLVVGNPTRDLAHAETEAVQVAGMFGVQPILGSAATRDEVLRALRDASVAHLAAHARFSADAPLEAGVVLADGVLTAREIMSERIRLDFLALSACDTGVTESLGGHEFAGLSQAFLVAGARCLVASLWKVDDRMTSTLMKEFYQSWRSGSDPARALRDATAGRASAGDSQLASPWNAFVVSGDWSVEWPTA